ncbi:hypothetical protein HYH03_004269 [Edaphochlamys debaryana]|uniref:ARID domain-containing protein n=1 Tax=Edaphochlamys debaryana TaxID=47281 RepID=A0A836C2H3_9CHLO|nr:hypothetical protein HYH03_004269 [Edaphochlamys debaryana]|eukprot:KAG2498011.1 hypothetical protein HYH03_004269 [Edaphochlamys debaryana]
MAAAPRWRVVACVASPGTSPLDCGGVAVHSAVLDLSKPDTQLPNAQVTVLQNPSLAEFNDAVAVNRPNLVYCCGPSSQHDPKQAAVVGPFQFRGDKPHGEDVLLAALGGSGAEVVFVDAVVSPHFGPALHHRGPAHVVVWPAGTAIPTAVAALFNAAFLSFLACSAASPPEAFAAASHCTQAHCTQQQQPHSPPHNPHQAQPGPGGPGAGPDANGGPTYPPPPLPAFVSSVRPALPDSSSIPQLSVPGLAVEQSQLPSFPGWTDVRLLAPRAELRLLLCGGSGLIDSVRLSFLGEALRGLLVMEARGLTLTGRTPLEALPRNLPPGCQAVRCDYATASGAPGAVVLGAPPSVLQHEGLVQHALRMTLVTDSVSLQFRLPPPGLSLPTPRSSSVVAGGVPVVDTVAVTSVWAVEVLRSLCKDVRYRSLAALGVAAVGNAADTSFTPSDVQRLTLLVVNGLGAIPPAMPYPSSSTPGAAAGGGGASSDPASMVPADSLPSPSATCNGGEATGMDVDALLNINGGHVNGLTVNGLTANGHGEAPMATANGVYLGTDAALMGYSLNGQLHSLDNGGAAAGAAAAASPDSPGPDGAAGEAGGLSGSAAGDGIDGSPDGRGGRPAGPLSDRRPNLQGDLPGYTCRRPPLACCSEAQFYDDLTAFLALLRGKPIDRARFPEAVLNGVSLDLFSLYREVVSRGGFRVGNGINWKGQVFPRMRNWTESNKQTGVGNALKRHYQNYLMEYEAAHPEDVTLDRCVLCNGGDQGGTDWLCCDACENWVHLVCDKRPGLGAYADYTQGAGRVYVCPSCAREQEATGEGVKRMRTA